jgi:hypothetical protein
VRLKLAWFILLVSAVTDFVISAATSLISVMLATGSPQMPEPAVWVIVTAGGLVAAARTIQQGLKETALETATLRGDPPPKV